MLIDLDAGIDASAGTDDAQEEGRHDADAAASPPTD
jgi:hypothetical protein